MSHELTGSIRAKDVGTALRCIVPDDINCNRVNKSDISSYKTARVGLSLNLKKDL